MPATLRSFVSVSITLRQLAPCLFAALSLVFVLDLHAWDRVITFNEYPPGDYHGPENNPVNAEAVHVTRDEGWEGDYTGGFGVQRIVDDGTGNHYYTMHTLGRGESWGHVFSLVNFPELITDKGTIYFEFAQSASSNRYALGFSEAPATPAENSGGEGYFPHPWGWQGMDLWGQIRGGIFVLESNELLVLSSSFTLGFIDDEDKPEEWNPVLLPYGDWHRIWYHVSPGQAAYELWLQNPSMTQPYKVCVLELSIMQCYIQTRSSPYTIQSLVVNTLSGNPTSPNLGDPWYINNIAVYNGVHTLERPPGTEMAKPPEVLLPAKWGFRQLVEDSEWYLDGISFLGCFHGEFAPWIYSFNLGTWIYAGILDSGSGTPIAETQVRRYVAGSWNYIWNSGPGAEDLGDGNVHAANYLGYLNTDFAPWIYLWDLGTWGYLAEGDWNADAAWLYTVNGSR